MRFQAVKGTRDFYPPEMRLRNWISDAWRRVSLRNGFEEYDSPIFEYLDLFTIKSGEGIASELFNLTDRGGRQLAIRPETTPALGRMVNARINTLARPIKWFTIQRLCRAENPQRGRLREFFCWNIDIIGADEVIADAECIAVAADFLREVGLTPAEVCVRIGSRALTMAALATFGVAEAKREKVLAVLDKRPKVSEADFAALCAEAGLSGDQAEAIRRYQDAESLEAVAELVGASAAGPVAELRELFNYLEALGAGEYCRLDLRIVRGLAYYTGIVYEIFDAGQGLRAVAGGGRYDNLLEVLGGPAVGATGFGMGDVVLGLLLEETGKLPADLDRATLDFFVIDAQEGAYRQVLEVTASLRQAGFSADFSYKRQGLGKQLKAANRQGARTVVICRGSESVDVKDLRSGEQIARPLAAFLAEPTGTEST